MTYQPRRALRADGCMRLFGTNRNPWGDAELVSWDHVVYTHSQRRRDGYTEGLGGLHIEDQVELGGLLDGKVGGRRALKMLSTKLAARR